MNKSLVVMSTLIALIVFASCSEPTQVSYYAPCSTVQCDNPDSFWSGTTDIYSCSWNGAEYGRYVSYVAWESSGGGASELWCVCEMQAFDL